ncbi:MAG TPA: hypothetical protein VKB04_02420, partial [Anaerolineales bacterium]|nr:hypothetical protein [Anaerolineales bacterium]
YKLLTSLLGVGLRPRRHVDRRSERLRPTVALCLGQPLQGASQDLRQARHSRFSRIGGKPTVRTVMDPWLRLRQFQPCQFAARQQACLSISPTSTNSRGRNLGGGRTPQEQEMVKCESESMDRQIDTLVYALYGLTEEEIRIVER